MPRSSKPAALVPIRNRSRSISYHVNATVRGKQRKKSFLKLPTTTIYGACTA